MNQLPKTFHAIEPSIIVLIVVIFVMDCMTPLGVSVWLLYFLPIFLASWSRRNKLEYITAGLCILLTLAGIIFSPPSSHYWLHVFFRWFGSALFILSAFMIANRRQKIAELLDSEKRFRSLVNASSQSVWRYRSADAGLDEFHTAWWREFTGQTEEQRTSDNGAGWLHSVHNEDQIIAGSFWDSIRSNRPHKPVEYRIRRNDGEWRWFCVQGVHISGDSGSAFEWSGTFSDVTERRRAEEERRSIEIQMQQAQKLESLGVLAGGIAHDFNNLLMVIIGNVDLACMLINNTSPVVENLRNIETAAARAADLAKQMLAYSGKGKFVIEPIDLSQLVEDMLHMLEVSISKKAVLRLNLASNLPTVEVDTTQIRQVIMNLVINASEAIDTKSGVIAITTGCMQCDQNYFNDVWLSENLGEGLYVYMEIADTGCGMDRETMEKLFDPFFTTKFTGRGLGMAAVLGIIRGHHGAIKLYSEPKKGTNFKILLPAAEKPAQLFNHVDDKDDWKGEGTVLLVDDEETVRAIGSDMLKALGFDVITAEDGRQGIDKFTANPGIEFVVLDLTMPHVDGEECFRELRRIKPDVKVIMSSGYNEQEVSQKFVGKGLAGFIQKPYKLSTLRNAIRGIHK